MVGESQSLGARGYRVVDRPLGGRVAPARLLRILRNRVLRVVNDEVRVRKEIDVTLVLLVPRWLTLGSCRRVRGMRLVIHRVHNRIAAGLQAIAQRESRVIEILRGDAHFTNRKFSLGDIVKANRRCQLRQRDGEVIVLHLTRQRPFELASERPWSIDVPGVAGHEQWCEKGEPLDMIPVRVGDHEMSVAARPGGQQRLA